MWLLTPCHRRTCAQLKGLPVPPFSHDIPQVKVRYNANPFHNFRHAFRVSHVAFLFVARSDLRGRALRDLDVLALLFSAICHDLEHPGLTNAYQVNTKHRLALVYNDQSVLENHHCATAFRVVERPECDILRGLPKGDYKLFRKLVVAAILATDMTAHKGIVAVVSARVEADQTGSGGFDRDSLEDRQLLARAPPPVGARVPLCSRLLLWTAAAELLLTAAADCCLLPAAAELRAAGTPKQGC